MVHRPMNSDHELYIAEYEYWVNLYAISSQSPHLSQQTPTPIILISHF